MTLPPLYDRWMLEALGASVRGEARSTCSDCAMCPKHPDIPPPHFRPDVKCCGYRPALPNFLVGAILKDDAHPEGQRTMRVRLAEKVGVTPLGAGVSPEYATAHRTTPFGSDPGLICPHFTLDGGGTCTIWAYREAVCTTWFCRHDRGEVGNRFWTALQHLLDGLQHSLARQVAAALGAEPPYGWGTWAPRDEAFFVACAERVAALSWAEVEQRGGFEAQVRLREVRETFEAREHPTLPPRVRLAPVAVSDLPDGRVRFRTGSDYDAFDADVAVLETLGSTDGMLTALILSDGLLDPETLQALVDHEVLVPAEDDAPTDPFALLG